MGDLADSVGGIIEMHYSHPLLGPIYPIRLAVTSFDPAPIGASNNYLYTGAGAFVPSESGIIATFAAVAALWAPYYAPDWTLTLGAMWLNSGGLTLPLTPVPDAAAVAGNDSATYTPGSVTKRWIGLYSRGGSLWRVFLRQLGAQSVGQTVNVGPSSGGLDSRDHAWYAYIAAGGSALCGRDGLALQPGGKARAWFDTPPAPYVVSG